MKRAHRWQLLLAVAALLAPVPLTVPAAAADRTGTAAEEKAEDVIGQILAGLTRELRTTANDPGAGRVLFQALTRKEKVDPLTVFDKSVPAAERFNQLAVESDAAVKKFQGLPKMVESSLAIQLYDPKGMLGEGKQAYYAAEPTGDEEDLTSFEAESSDGKPVTLDVKVEPEAPVIMVELDMANILPNGLTLFVETLRLRGVLGDVLLPIDQVVKRTDMDSVQVKNDQEPWYKGAAEMFMLTMGGQNGQARVDVMDLGYLNFDGTVYQQPTRVVDWTHFSWSAVDLLMMEGDAVICDAGWARYAQVVANAVQSQGSGPSYQNLIGTAKAALADKDQVCDWWYPNWLIDLPDYADSFPAFTTASVGLVTGQSSNARTTMSFHTQ